MTLTTHTTGQGTVAPNPSGGSYASGTQVQLTATAGSGWSFDHWEGDLTGNTNPATLTMNADADVTAVFAEDQGAGAVEWTQLDITADTTIPAGNYRIDDDIRVHGNAILTISPGATLRFASGTWLYVESDGALNAVGTASSPITLTGQTQSPGFWIGVRFQDSNSLDNDLQHVTIKCGGYDYASVAADLFVGGTSRVAVSNCTLRESGSLGFVFHDDPTITFANNIITANTDGAGEVEPQLVGVLTTTSTYTDNTHDVMLVRSGNTTVDQTWSDLGLPYIMADDLTVDHHTTFAPGVQVEFPTNSWLYVSNTGSLTANGTPVNQITLTGQTQAPGFWRGVRFVDSNSLDNSLQYITIKYGGYTYASVSADLFVGGTSRVAVSHCMLRDSGSLGFVFHDNPTITFENNDIIANLDGAGEVEPWQVGVLTTTSHYTGNTTDVMLVRSGNTTVDQTWSDLGLTYVMANDLTVDHQTTFAPGVQVEFPTDSWLYVSNTGSLTANGTVGNPILLTTQIQNPGPGSWIGVRFDNSNSLNNSLQYVTIAYGGSSYASVSADLYVIGTSRLDMQHCTITNSFGWGIYYQLTTTFTESNTSYTNNATGTKGHP